MKAQSSLVRLAGLIAASASTCLASPLIASTPQPESAPPLAPTLERLQHPDPKIRLEAVHSLTQLRLPSLSWQLTSLLADPDPAVRNAAIQGLIALQNPNPPLAALLAPSELPPPVRRAALQVLQHMQREATVNALLERLHQQPDTAARLDFASALCGLYWLQNPPQTPETKAPEQRLPWSQTERIAQALQALLQSLPDEGAATLSLELARHRIRLPGSLEKLSQLSPTRPDLREALARLSALEPQIPSAISNQLARLLKEPSEPQSLRLLAAQALAKSSEASALEALSSFLREQPAASLQQPPFRELLETFEKATALASLLPAAQTDAATLRAPAGPWAENLLVLLASRSNSQPNVQRAAVEALQTGWKSSEPRRRQILSALLRLGKTVPALEVSIAEQLEDAEEPTRRLAQEVVSKLKLNPDRLLGLDQPGPLLATLSSEEALRQALEGRGRKADGQKRFQEHQCADCHSLSETSARRGPFLGRIGLERSRQQLAESLLAPDRSILKGFETHLLRLQDGRELTGLIVRESTTETVLLDPKGQEIVLETPSILSRQESPRSLMPALDPAHWNLRDFRSLLDYLQSLGGKAGAERSPQP